jgi:hypothetical protein
MVVPLACWIRDTWISWRSTKYHANGLAKGLAVPLVEDEVLVLKIMKRAARMKRKRDLRIDWFELPSADPSVN